MPNWCNNTLTITGAADRLAELRAHLAEPYHDIIGNQISGDLLLMNMVNPWRSAKEKEDYASKSEAWYDLHVTYWGTKWEIEATLEETDSANELTYSFDSAWSPPEAAIEACSTDWPDLVFHLEYDEPGNDFAGKRTFLAGAIIESEDSTSRSYYCEVCEEYTYCEWDSDLGCAYAGKADSMSVKTMPGLLHAICQTDTSLSLIAEGVQNLAASTESSNIYLGTQLSDVFAEATHLDTLESRIPLFPETGSMPTWLAHSLLAGLSQEDIAAALNHENEKVKAVALLGTVGEALAR